MAAAADSLRNIRGLGQDLAAPEHPENVRGAKEWLTAHMITGRSYRSTVHQPALAAIFDMAAARRRSPSFDKFWRELERIATEAQTA